MTGGEMKPAEVQMVKERPGTQRKGLITQEQDIRGQSGFTILELLIVLSLVALITGMSSMLVLGSALPSARLNATARELSATMREARSLARVSGDRQIVTIDLDARTYGIEGRRSRSVPGDTGILVRDPFTGEIRHGKYPMAFNASGGAESGTIVLWHGKKAISIQSDPIAGSVAIKQ